MKKTVRIELQPETFKFVGFPGRAVTRLLGAVLTCFLAAGSLTAQGKLAGRIVDRTSGEPLIGANIYVESTQQGTITDVNGDYVLLNLRPGEYTIVYSYIGYATQRVEGVAISTNHTTRYDVELRSEAVAGQEVVVQAERPLIQRDLTASKRTVISEEIEVLPVESFLGVLTTQAGVTQGPGGELHIRGGRSNEIAYLVDGLSVANPFSTNGLATEVATNAVQEMTVVTGAFNAEYGQAMSGIVNIVTREGGPTFDASASMTLGDRVTGNDDVWQIPDGVSVRTRTVEATLGGPILGSKLTFFAAGRWDDSDGYIYGYREHLPSDSANFNTAYYEIHGRPWWEYEPFGELNVPRDPVEMNPFTSYNFTGKLAFRPKPQLKLEYTHLRDGRDGKGSGVRATDFLYRYVPDGLANTYGRSWNHAVHWTHTVNRTMFYTVRLSYASDSFKRYLYEDPTDPRYVRDVGGTGEGNVVGFPGNNFYMSGNQKDGLFEEAKSFRGKVDLTKQFGTIHEAKIGVDWRFHTLDREVYTVLFDGNIYRQPTLPPLNSPSHDLLRDQSAKEISAYIQDKLEFEEFIINAGVRFDRFDPDGLYIPDVSDPWEDRLNRVINTEKADPKRMISPRLGVSLPVTSRGIVHFSYGHFYQMPTLRQMYINPEFEFGVGTIPEFGNANLRPQKTVSYEFGLQQQLSDQVAFDVTGFFKDIRDLLARQRIRFSTIPGEDALRMWSNKDYANVKGIMFALTKRRSPNGLLSANIDYTFLVAKGNNDDTDAFFFNLISGREDEFELVPLDFDQRHILSGTVTISRPNNWGLSFIGQIASGYPYSPLIIDQNLDLLPNSENKPAQIKLDARLSKEFRIGDVNLMGFVKVFNLLDRLNERTVFTDTGRAGSTLNRDNIHAFWQNLYGLPAIHDLDDYNTRPHFYSAPREIRVGLSMSL